MSHNHMKKPPKGEPWSPVVNVALDTKKKSFEFTSTDIDVDKHNGITFENEGQPGFLITYRLQDPTDGYRFPENLDDALWVIDQPVCPDETNRKNKWGIFLAKAVNNNGRDLVVRNLNTAKQQFGYAPRVVNDAGDWWNLDPVGTNDNGSVKAMNLSAYVVAAIGGVVVGILLTLGVQGLLGIKTFG